jgi:cell division protein FtsQ
MFMLKYFNDINRLFAPLHAKISYLELTPYLTWKLRLNNGITMQMGHKDILTRLGHFVKVYPKIVGARAIDVDYIDLRYPNGLAVRWKTAHA